MDLITKQKIKKKLKTLEIVAIVVLIPLSVFTGTFLTNKFLPGQKIDFSNLITVDNFLSALFLFIFLCIPFAISFTIYEIVENILLKPYLNGKTKEQFLEELESKEVKIVNDEKIEEYKYENGIRVLDVKELEIKETPVKVLTQRVLIPRTLSKDEEEKFFKRYPYIKRYVYEDENKYKNFINNYINISNIKRICNKITSSKQRWLQRNWRNNPSRFYSNRWKLNTKRSWNL